jgi:hypothetical protein
MCGLKDDSLPAKYPASLVSGLFVFLIAIATESFELKATIPFRNPGQNQVFNQ